MGGRTKKRKSSGKRASPAKRRLRRAVEVISAQDHDQIHARGAERGAVARTSRWYHDDPNVVGLAIGRKFEDGKPVARSCVCVLVRRKRSRSKVSRKKQIRPFTLGGRRVETDVVEICGARLHGSFGLGPGVGLTNANPGSMCGVLEDDEDGTLYLLSAAHVLAQLWSRPDSSRRIRLAPKGASVFDLGTTGVLQPGQESVARFHDRSLLDFDNQFPFQSVDAAIARLDPNVRTRLDRQSLPYSRVDRPGIGDRVMAHGVGLAPATRKPGQVLLRLMELKDPVMVYGGPGDRAKEVSFSGVFVGEYDAGPGDSGGAIVRESDGALVGMHLGAVDLRVQQGGPVKTYAIFIDIQRVLGRWPSLTLWNRGS